MLMRSRNGRMRLLGVMTLLASATALLGFGGAASGAPAKTQAEVVVVDTLPIANARPLDLGIAKGFFAQQNIEIKKQVLQSGNDIVLAAANHNGDIGYISYVPAMVGRTQGIEVSLVAASDVEGTSIDDNWQNILVKGSSSIQKPADLAGKTIAVNALKGLGEVIVKAALEKSGVDPNSIKLLALPFPSMRSALANGQVDAVWTPEPFVSQILSDGGRIVLAPGPTIGKFLPNGGYFAIGDWATKNPGIAKRFATALKQSIQYAQTHTDEVRALAPPLPANVRLPIWSAIVDRAQLLTLAKYAKEFGVITTLPNFTKLIPSTTLTGLSLQATVGSSGFVTLRLNGKVVTKLSAGKYAIIVSDQSTSDNFHLKGPGFDKATSVPKKESLTWTATLAKGTYAFGSDGHKSRNRTFAVR
jgi:NitT/TauT family transport system substrate-binding protein